MDMVMQKKEMNLMHSLKIQHNGAIEMVMDIVTILMETLRMICRMIPRSGAIWMGMDTAITQQLQMLMTA